METSDNNAKKEFIMPNSKRINYIKLNKKLVDDYIKMVNDSETYSYISRNPRTFTRVEEEVWVEEKLKDNSRVFSMLEKGTNKFIGNIEIMNHDNEIGICITRDMQDKHYGLEAIKTIIDYCFNILNFDVVTLKVHQDNPRAIKCYKNSGFEEYDRDEQDIFMHIKRK